MKNILYGFIAGDNSVFTESQSDQCLLNIIYEMISKVFPKLKIPKPTNIIRSKWHAEEYTKGSYSYIPMGASTNDMQTLANPFVNKNL